MATSRSSATRLAKPLRIARVEKLSQTQDVWCLTVPDGGVFALANGAVVHNSDALRTASEAKPTVRAGQTLRQRVPYAAMGQSGILMPQGSGLAIDYDDPLQR
jgi:hypothetical protein